MRRVSAGLIKCLFHIKGAMAFDYYICVWYIRILVGGPAERDIICMCIYEINMHCNEIRFDHIITICCWNKQSAALTICIRIIICTQKLIMNNNIQKKIL